MAYAAKIGSISLGVAPSLPVASRAKVDHPRQMKRATLDEVKKDLSSLLELVQEGETVLLFDQGRPVAHLVPVFQVLSEDEERLARLERQGVI